MPFAWNPNERLGFDVRLEAIDEAIAEDRYDDAADELATMLEHGAKVLARLRDAGYQPSEQTVMDVLA